MLVAVIVRRRMIAPAGPGVRLASYLRPKQLQAALDALAAKPWTLLAGGTDHFPARAIIEPDENVLDLSGIERLNQVERTVQGWRLSALVTWSQLIKTALPPLFDGLKQAACQVGGRQVQNSGTIVGNVCNASPAADGIPALLALDARVELRSATAMRTLPLGAFVLGPRCTARREDEMVTALIVPNRDARSQFHKLGGRRYLVISISMVAVTLGFDAAGCVSHAAVAVGACGPRAVRLAGLEAALIGMRASADLVRAEHLEPLAPIDDLRAPAEYRRKATLELLRRALTPAMKEAA